MLYHFEYKLNDEDYIEFNKFVALNDPRDSHLPPCTPGPLLNRFFTFLANREIKKLAKYGKLPYGKDNSLRFGEDFFVEIEDEVESKIKYTSIEKIVCSEHTMYIFLSVLSAVILPFSAFKSDAQRSEFLAFINGKIVKTNAVQ